MSTSMNPALPPRPPPKDRGVPTPPTWWSKVGFAVVAPPQGKYSRRKDERCFIYCSQSVNGRIEKQEPQCRSVCIRHVFAHEVRNTITQDNHDNSLYNIGNRTTAEHAKYPLPPEGQRADEVPGGGSESDRYENKLREKDAKYWREGWYLWYSKNRWATQEKLELMMHDLAVHSNWYRHMEQQKVEWERERGGKPDIDLWEPPSMSITAPRRPFHDPSKQSILVPLPLPLPPIFDQIQTLLKPTFKTTTILRESFESGAQKELAVRAWKKAWSGEPFILARNACSRMWKLWKGDDPKDP